ncbi:hypothetical protein BH11MYX3_BH11MYX3_10650 [soil metagenome]
MEQRADRFRRLLVPLHDQVLGFARSLCRLTSGSGDDLDPNADQLYRTEAWKPGGSDANRRARSALARLPAAMREAIVRCTTAWSTSHRLRCA